MLNETFGYSGRGMFGEQCLAIVGLESLLTLIREEPDFPTDGWRSDSLGRDTVYYNPRILFEK